jgi:hypothetical protein
VNRGTTVPRWGAAGLSASQVLLSCKFFFFFLRYAVVQVEGTYVIWEHASQL